MKTVKNGLKGKDRVVKLKVILFWGLFLVASCKMADPTADIEDITPSETPDNTDNPAPPSDTDTPDPAPADRELNEGLLDDIDLDYMSYRSAPAEYQNFVVVYSDESDGEISLKEQVCCTFNQAKLNYSLVDMEDFKTEISTYLAVLDSQDVLVFASERLWRLEEIERNLLLKAIEDGTNSIFLINTRYDDDIFKSAVGITSGGTVWPGGSGIRITKNIFPGFDNTYISSIDFLNSASIAFELSTDATVIAESSEGTPYIWKYNHGLGNIVYTNSSLFQGKSFRGLLLQCLSLVPDYFLSTQYNSALFYIDDFPVSIPAGEIGTDLLEPYEGMSKIDFINHVWWPDIKNLQESHNLKYTALAVGNYINVTEGDLYEFTDEDRENFAYHGALLKEVGAELGIHGYNHVSLVLNSEFTDDTTSTKWPGISAMSSCLNDLKRMMDDLFDHIPYYSYVPPMNRMSSSGKTALLDVFPQISNIAAVNQGIENYGDLIQEIEEDPIFSHWFDIPRFSSGYLQGDNEKWLIYDALAYSGVFSHFIHPDDAMDTVRNEGNNWDSMYSQFDNCLDEIFSDFPDLKRISSAQMAKITRAQEGMDVYSWKDGNSIRIRYSEGATPVYHYLRIQPGQGIESVQGGTVKALQSSSGLYLLTGTARDVTVNLHP
ncbi:MULTISPECIES: DUF2194 domain-containing protein [unclassified Oceanispirochaeta]|uniref:DUF2194 domain-containing protein n=1 Tax=unclassified Oceanispirochaeta TaxID=2635722 RepID=UPI000E09DD5B|nr:MULTISPECIES: DUF2194 domain-containing protein [unclassified Oceanispirochaeta]MBF9016417.1 DUF2194 domain-containing protein [Oceanispirochaeta sp. M2]NPD72879.1 DUF2194 domain-containing protein [Oceanispirochaeta sp. M1]RDG31456.1 DUF2194 domain-containing protein [Oceanispirochaeta sp. M1]